MKKREKKRCPKYPKNEYDKRYTYKRTKKKVCNNELNKCVGCELPSK